MTCTEMNNKKLLRRIAIVLITLSFVLYAIMPFNACLPFSTCVIIGITGGMMIVSEIIFWIGSLMIGREVAMKIRKKISISNFLGRVKESKKENEE